MPFIENILILYDFRYRSLSTQREVKIQPLLWIERAWDFQKPIIGMKRGMGTAIKKRPNRKMDQRKRRDRKFSDVDFEACQIRITQGNGKKTE